MDNFVPKIQLIKLEDLDIGFKRLKNAPLEECDSLIYEYKMASMTTKTFSMSQVKPTTYYLLESNINNIIELEKVFRTKYSIDIFNLSTIVYFKLYGQIKAIAPPFIEEYFEEDGEKVVSLQDGAHRFYVASKMKRKVNCIFIKNHHAKIKYLPYARPNSWDNVVIYNQVPKIKKNYRRELKYSYMRPLQSLFDPKIIKDWSDYNRIGT